MSSDSADIEPVRPFEVYVELNKIAYSRQYALNIYNDTSTTTVKTATRIKVELFKSSNNYCNGSGAMVAREFREAQGSICTSAGGSNNDPLCPNTATQIFNVTAGQNETDNALSGGYTYRHVVYNPANLVNTTYARDAGSVITITQTNHGLAVNDYVDISLSLIHI